MPGIDHGALLPAEAADRLIAAHDAEVALLYIYIRRAGSFDAERAAHDLCRTLREVQSAEEKLRRMGLFSDGPAAATEEPAGERLLPPEDKLPEYTAQELARRSREDDRLSIIYQEAAQVFGRKLSGADMNMLHGIYVHLGLPAEVVLELLNYCAQTAEEKKAGRRPSPRAVEREAYAWANQEILTLELAEEYIRRQRALRDEYVRARKALNIRDRDLSTTERAYVRSWLELGFGEEALAIAYDRTVTNTGSLKWKYMDTILRSWHEKKLHTAAEIRAGDSRSRPARGAAGEGAGASKEDYVFPDKL